MKLIPMTTFVLEQTEDSVVKEAGVSYQLALIHKYAKFLSQPLALWMFVPCDENGNVLEEPEYFKYHSQFNRWEDSKFDGYFDDENDFKDWEKECIKYIKSKERCLFEGFEVHEVFTGVNEKTKTISLGGLINVFWFDTVTQTWNPSIGVKNIEGLVNYGLTLTETALKTL